MKFRKKPIEVEAYQLTEEKEIHTREGTLKGYPGDWIITGIQGEQYPCGKEIFEQTYEPAGSRPAPSAPEYTLEEVIKIDKQIRHAQQVAAAQARKDEREKVLKELESLMDEDLYFTDYSGNTISLPIEKWDKIRKSLRREVPE